MLEFGDTEKALIFFLISMATGIVVWWGYEILPRKMWKPPFTVMIFLIGIGISAWSESQDLGHFGDTIRDAQNVGPSVILFVLLPPLIFESSYSMDFHVFAKVSYQSLWLAGPGLIMITLLVGSLIYGIFDFSWDISTSFLLASILAATDPVAVVAALNSLGAPKKLSSLIDGESLLNDGSAFVLFSVFLELAAGVDKSVDDIFVEFVRLTLGAVAWGYGMGLLTVFCLSIVFDDMLTEISIALVAMISTFLLAEVELKVSGILSVVVFGLYLSLHGQWAFSPEVKESFTTILEQLSFFATIVIFFLSGVVGYDKMFSSSTQVGDESRNWGYLILLFILLNLFRFLVVAVSYPLLSRMGYGLSWKEAALISWGGLRGAVGLALGLLVEAEKNIPEKDRNLINFFVSGVVILSLLLNGTTTDLFYKYLAIYPVNPYRKFIFRKAIDEIEARQSRNHIKQLKADWLYSHANWETVKALVPDFRKADFVAGHISYASFNLITFTLSLRDLVSKFEHDQFKSLKQTEKDFPTKPHDRRSKLISIHRKSGTVNLKENCPRVQEDDLNMDKQEVKSKIESDDDVLFSSLATKAIGLHRRMSMKHFSETQRQQEIVESIFRYLRAEYLHQFQTRQLGRHSITILIEAAEHASEAHLEHGSKDLVRLTLEAERRYLCNAIKKMTPPWLLSRISNTCLRSVFQTFLFQRLFLVIELYCSFIRAHHDLVELFQEATPDPETFQCLHEILYWARGALQDLREQFPVVFLVAQTTFTARYLIKLKIGAVDAALSHGLLEVSEGEDLIAILDSRLISLQFITLNPFIANCCFDQPQMSSEIELIHVNSK